MAVNPPRTDFKVTNIYHHPAAGVAATKTITGGTGKVMVVDQIIWSFDRALAAASSVLIESPAATTLFKIDLSIAAVGSSPAPCSLEFPKGFNGALGQDVVVTLGGTAGAEVGKLNVLYH